MKRKCLTNDSHAGFSNPTTSEESRSLSHCAAGAEELPLRRITGNPEEISPLTIKRNKITFWSIQLTLENRWLDFQQIRMCLLKCRQGVPMTSLECLCWERAPRDSLSPPSSAVSKCITYMDQKDNIFSLVGQMVSVSTLPL